MNTVLENCKKLASYITGREIESYSNYQQGRDTILNNVNLNNSQISNFSNGYKGNFTVENKYLPPNCKNTLTNEDYFQMNISLRQTNNTSNLRNTNTTKFTQNTTEFENIYSPDLISQNRPLCQSNLNNFSNLRKNFEKLNVVYNTKTYPVNPLKKNDKIDESVNFLISEKKYKSDDFIILKLLGKGTFGKVLLVRNKKDNKLYAMKVLKKEKVFKFHQIDHTKTEREILEKINHPFIVKLYFAFQTEEKLYLVTEFMQGGELFFHLKRERIFSEEKAKLYVCEIVLAIEHLHRSKIIYRDLKPENILLDTEGHIKLADFGLSKFFNSTSNCFVNCNNNSDTKSNFSNDNSFISSDKAFTLCGTPEYLAPEILTGKGYDKSVDWWSLGVLLYEILCGSSPFKKRKRNEKLNLEYYHTPILFNNCGEKYKISENAKNLILLLLKHNPNERLNNSILIKEHPFFNGVNWDEILDKKVIPQFIPRLFLKSDDDLSFFDKSFTNTIVIKDHKGIIEDNCLLNKNDIECIKAGAPTTNVTENLIYKNNQLGNKYLKDKNLHKPKKKKREDKEDFKNFSFTRDEGLEFLK